jgi:hypothetical protein
MKRISSLALLTIILASPAAARADILYAMNHGILTHVDTDTLTATPIGDTGIFSISGIDFGPDGQMYGIAPDTREFIRIDVTTAAVSVVGSLGISMSRGSGLGWDHTTGTMYTVAKLTASSPDLLSTIDMASGAATVVAEVQGIGGASLYGLDFDFGGSLYGVQGRENGYQLWAIDKSDGSTVPVGDESLPPIGSFTISPSGTAWILEAPGYLYSVDLEDGSTTEHGLVTGFVNGPFGFGGLTSIPTPSASIAVLAGLLCAYRRSRKPGE